MAMKKGQGISPLTTWHSQTGLLLISATWGLSYLMPLTMRIPFSEVFPQQLTKLLMPMWAWGLVLLLAATAAFLGERGLRWGMSDRFAGWAWRLEFIAHMVLALTYATLSLAALYQGVFEVQTSPFTLCVANIVSAVSRPVLWIYIGYLHTTYARLPRPH